MSFLAAKKIREREEHRLGTTASRTKNLASSMDEKMKLVKEVLVMEEEEQRERSERSERSERGERGERGDRKSGGSKSGGRGGAMRITLRGGGINMKESKELDRIIENELNWSISNQEELERYETCFIGTLFLFSLF